MKKLKKSHLLLLILSSICVTTNTITQEEVFNHIFRGGTALAGFCLGSMVGNSIQAKVVESEITQLKKEGKKIDLETRKKIDQKNEIYPAVVAMAGGSLVYALLADDIDGSKNNLSFTQKLVRGAITTTSLFLLMHVAKKKDEITNEKANDFKLDMKNSLILVTLADKISQTVVKDKK